MNLNDAYLSQRFTDVEQALAKALAWGAADPQLSAYLAGYLVVLISGVYEDCIEYLVGRRAGLPNDTELASYVRQRTSQSFRNPDMDKVRALLKDFSPDYRAELDKKVTNAEKVALNSIVENKNWLAHGETHKLHVTVADVDAYFQRAAPIFEALENIL